MTAFTGSLTFVYIHLALFGGWIAWNLPFSPLPRFDPSLVVLAMVASVEAIFLSTFILISQNRMQALAEARANLDLQVNLLAEHEVTRLIRLTRAIAARLGIEDSQSPDLRELEQDVAPEKVLDRIEIAGRDEDPRHERGGPWIRGRSARSSAMTAAPCSPSRTDRPWTCATRSPSGTAPRSPSCLGGAFAVLTAAHPSGEEPEDLSPDRQDVRERENVRRVPRLEEALLLARVPFRRVDAEAQAHPDPLPAP